ncbi:hypothetical protein PV458_35330 [Streptomyces sp. MN03-5084-2B]|nr:hypothetical protein [Streptomyces sp. MN03-5084-2B]
MSETITPVLTVAVLVFVFIRQFRRHKLKVFTWLLPVIPVVLGCLQPDLIDHAKVGTSIGLGAGVVVVGILLGAVYGMLLKVSRDSDGVTWLQGGWIAVPFWAALVLSRQAFHAIGNSMDTGTSFGFVAISFGAMLLARTVVVAIRSARSVRLVPASADS